MSHITSISKGAVYKDAVHMCMSSSELHRCYERSPRPVALVERAIRSSIKTGTSCSTRCRLGLDAYRRRGAKRVWWSSIQVSRPDHPPLVVGVDRDMAPHGPSVVGPTRYRNLWLKTEHGTLGWNVACGSGQLMADLISGRRYDLLSCAVRATPSAAKSGPAACLR